MTDNDRAEQPQGQPLRVAILVRRWGGGGGNERNAVELVRHLVRRGHTVQVHCQRADGTADVELPAGALHRHAGLRFDPSLAMLSFAWAAARVVRSLRARGAVDAVIGFDHSTLHDVYRLGRGVHAAYLAQAGESAEAGADAPPARARSVVDRVALLLERQRMRPERFHTLIAVSDAVRDQICAHYAVDRARIRVVRNGVDLERFTTDAPAGERSETRARWGVQDDERVLLLVGRNPQLKGLDVAAEVARHSGCRLIYVGGEGTRARDCPPDVVWDGHRSDIAACYRSADLLIQPSRYEAFGNAALEAAACGLPAVARDDMGSTELFVSTPVGRLLVDDPADVAGMSERVRLGLSEQEHEGLRTEARRIAQSCGRERWAVEMEAVLRAAATEGR